MDDKTLHVDGCPLCEIFLNPKKNIRTRLYWPESIDDVPDSEFVILECETCKVPMIVVSNHVTEIHKESWGRILYRCRVLFGNGVRLRTRMRRIRDHIHFHKL